MKLGSPETAMMENDSYELIEESPISTIYRVRQMRGAAESSFRAVKISTADRRYAKEPHDIHKEITVLSRLSHPNIITCLSHSMDSMNYQLWMPYIPYFLKSLLENPAFTPMPCQMFEEIDPSGIAELRFVLLAKSICYQILQALDYLHDPSRRIAHRDIKPGNILLTAHCQVKLIDFGIAWESIVDQAQTEDFWPEDPGNMYTEVASGSYRAPELLFGPRSYDAFAIDIWSLGTTFAEFFTSLKLNRTDHDEYGDDEDVDEDADEIPYAAFRIPRLICPGEKTFWSREPLFNAERGEIGLAWSIFKVMGTPNEENWPEFTDLPHSTRVTFQTASPADLRHFLPNLPTFSTPGLLEPSTRSFPDLTAQYPLDLVKRFLVYSPLRRLRPRDALVHPWFVADDVPLVLPAGHASAVCSLQWREHDLGYWLLQVLDNV